MKSLYESLLGDFESINDKINPEEEIMAFLKEYYFGCNKNSIKMKLMPNGKYEVNVYNDLRPRKGKLTKITNGMFYFNLIEGDVDFEKTLITSLEGSPKTVHGFFDCSDCKNLTSLKGSPKQVTQNFYCSGCPKLTSLEGGPKTITGSLYCADCGKQFVVKDIEKAQIKVLGEIDL